MSWRIVAASAIGTSHTATGGECQDSCFASIESASDKDPLLYMFIADGAGSAIHGGKGAELAIEVAVKFFAKQYYFPEFTLHDALAVDCMLTVRRTIDAHAEQEGFRARDYACTFLGLLSFSQSTLLMQIGDGGVVIDIGDGFHVPIEPMSGEYANMTCFATDNDAIDVLEIRYFPRKILKAALFSDGIQRLALNLATNTAYEPFFTPFFNTLSKATIEQEDQLQLALTRFLNSEAVNERTDDDKTLALAIFVE